MKPTFSITTARLGACALAACAATAAFAQSEQGAPRPAPHLNASLLSGPQRHEMLFFAGAQLERERIVQGAPYCADAVHETVQTLADGNRIVQRQQSRQCRDAQGRTRQEVVVPGGRRHVYLRDPVAQEAWMLDTEGKQAIRLDTPRRGPGADGAEPRAWDRLLGWSRDLAGRLRSKPAEAMAGPTPPLGPEPVRIVIGGPGAGELPPLPPPGAMPPPIAFHARLRGPRGAGVVTPLPTETIEGLAANGKRTTWTIEAGKIGNEKPIVVVSEVWSSPDLDITVRSRDADPMTGEENYRVQNVARGEPDPQLFRVPQDFKKIAPPTFMPGKP
jgi:hypothetical protein